MGAASNPLVSVLMPAYNTEKFVAETIGSILAQTYTNFEFLIQDDCSTDRTLEIIGSYNDPRIKIERNGCNVGPGATRNELIKRAKGKYLATVDSDDISEPNRLQMQVDFMERHPEISICGSYMSTIDENSVQHKSLWKYQLTHDRIKATMLLNSPNANPTTFFRRQPIVDNGLFFSEVYSPVDDLIFNGRAIDKVRYAAIPKPLVRYRIWSNQISHAKRAMLIEDAFGVIYSRIRLLDVELSDEQIRIFKKFIYTRDKYSDAELQGFRAIIVELWRGNKKTKCHAKFFLRNMIALKYKIACRRQHPFLYSRINQLLLWISLR